MRPLSKRAAAGEPAYPTPAEQSGHGGEGLRDRGQVHPDDAEDFRSKMAIRFSSTAMTMLPDTSMFAGAGCCGDQYAQGKAVPPGDSCEHATFRDSGLSFSFSRRYVFGVGHRYRSVRGDSRGYGVTCSRSFVIAFCKHPLRLTKQCSGLAIKPGGVVCPRARAADRERSPNLGNSAVYLWIAVRWSPMR